MDSSIDKSPNPPVRRILSVQHRRCIDNVLLIALLLLLGRQKAQALVFEEFTYIVTNNSITITAVDCWKVKSVLAIPAVIAGLSVTTIAARDPGNSGFLDCSSVIRVTIPNSVTNIGVGAFANSRGLKDITVDPTNPTYSSEDGVLFNKDRSTFLQYPLGRVGDHYTLPDTVKLELLRPQRRAAHSRGNPGPAASVCGCYPRSA